MKKYKGLIIIVVILVIYSLIMFFFFDNKDENSAESNSNNNTKIEENKYIVIGNSSYQYSNSLFSEIKNSTIEGLDSLKVYVNNSFYGNYKLKYVSNWNLFDKNNSFINYNGNLLAFSDNFNVKVRKYKIREINDNDKVFLINNYNLNTFSYLTFNQVIDIDLDNNGVDDEIICLSSMEDSDNINNYYNIVALRLNNEKVTLIEERGKDANYVYSIYSVLNIEDNSNDSIIIKRVEGYISESPTTSYLVYNYKNNNYIID